MAANATSFKPGQQAALGNETSGRPSEYDTIQEAKELLEWAQLDTSLRLYGFCNPKPYAFSKLSYFAERCPIFREALDKARNILALRREEHNNDEMLRDTVYNKTAHIYDSEMVSSDDDKAEKALQRELRKLRAEIAAKAESITSVSPDIIERCDALLDMMSKRQKDASKASKEAQEALNKAATTDKIEDKSA